MNKKIIFLVTLVFTVIISCNNNSTNPSTETKKITIAERAGRYEATYTTSKVTFTLDNEGNLTSFVKGTRPLITEGEKVNIVQDPSSTSTTIAFQLDYTYIIKFESETEATGGQLLISVPGSSQPPAFTLVKIE